MYQQQYHGQQQVVILSQPPPVEDKFKSSSSSGLLGLSITQIVMGCLCIIMGTILAIVHRTVTEYGSRIGYIGYGIWIGILFVALGIMGVRAAKAGGTCLITATMVLNILFPATVCLVFFGMTSAGLALTSRNNCHDVTFTYRELVPGYYSYWGVWVPESYRISTDYRYVCDEKGTSKLYWACDSMMLIMALVEFIITIVSAVLCCGAVCRCCKTQVGSTVQYVTRAQPQHVFVQPAAYPSVPNNYGYMYNPPAYPGIPMGYGAPPNYMQLTANHPQPPASQPQPSANHQQPPVSHSLPASHPQPPANRPSPANHPAPTNHSAPANNISSVASCPPAPADNQASAVNNRPSASNLPPLTSRPPPELANQTSSGGRTTLPPIGSSQLTSQSYSTSGAGDDSDIPPRYSSLH